MTQTKMLNRSTIIQLLTILMIILILMGFINYELLNNPNGIYFQSFYFLVLCDILGVGLTLMIIRVVIDQVMIRYFRDPGASNNILHDPFFKRP